MIVVRWKLSDRFAGPVTASSKWKQAQVPKAYDMKDTKHNPNTKPHYSAVADYLEMFRKDSGSDPFGRYVYQVAEQFVMVHGRKYELPTLPPQFRRGEKGSCFRNAYYLADTDRSLRYVEGFASLRNGRYPMVCPGLHAWCVTEEGNVLDPTWDNGIEYFGVAFDWEYVIRTISDRGRFGVIDNWDAQFPLFRGEDTEFILA